MVLIRLAGSKREGGPATWASIARARHRPVQDGRATDCRTQESDWAFRNAGGV